MSVSGRNTLKAKQKSTKWSGSGNVVHNKRTETFGFYFMSSSLVRSIDILLMRVKSNQNSFDNVAMYSTLIKNLIKVPNFKQRNIKLPSANSFLLIARLLKGNNGRMKFIYSLNIPWLISAITISIVTISFSIVK